jgi:hypothetical protein
MLSACAHINIFINMNCTKTRRLRIYVEVVPLQEALETTLPIDVGILLDRP